MPHPRLPQRFPQRQRGAVLYVAMIMLILLALLGIVGMQVTSLQERMSSNYNRVNAAFQNAEAVAREREAAIATAMFGGKGTFAADEESCDEAFDVGAWSDPLSNPNSRDTHVRRIDRCAGGPGSLKRGGKENEQTDNIYQVSALSGAHDASATAIAVVDTIYIP